MDFNIVTFHSALNCGAVLQAYALQTHIQRLGYSAGVFDYRPSASNRYAGLKGKIFKLLREIDKKQYTQKEERFSDFLNKYIHLNSDAKSKIFLAGSDQIWNTGNINPMYFLRFVGKESIRASYAASMATSDISEEKRRRIQRYLLDFDYISVREQSVAETLNNLVDTEINVNIDPTFLLSKEDWIDIASPVEDIPDKYTLVYIMHLSKNINKLLHWLKKETNEPIIIVDGQGTVQGKLTALVYNDMALHNVGPREFIWLISRASRVVTSSFHGTAFSLIFEKEFYSIVNPAAPSRIDNLLALVGEKSVSESANLFHRQKPVDWNQVRCVITEQKKQSSAYLVSLASDSNRKKREIANHKSSDISFVVDCCTGCGTCEQVCPVKAIQMELSEEGFVRPKINKRCIGCGKCYSKCPSVNFQGNLRKEAMYGWHKDREILFNSSSGGAFKSIADYIVSKKGIVFGAVYGEDKRTVVFGDSDHYSLRAIQKSKYTVSNMGDVYERISKELDKNRMVLFCGTPCQCAGINAFVDKEKRDNLLLVDFVCGGMASLRFYQEHLESLEKKYCSAITEIDFRPKDKGWGKHHLLVEFANGKRIFTREYNDAYFKCFVDDHISVSRTCLECDYHMLHVADFTLADFWGYRNAGVKCNKDGTSLVVANTTKGVKTLSCFKEMEMFPLDLKYTDYAFGACNPDSLKLIQHQQFFDSSKKMGFEKTSHSIYGVGTYSHIKKWIKNKLKK